MFTILQAKRAGLFGRGGTLLRSIVSGVIVRVLAVLLFLAPLLARA